jgi:hypothetical protein
MLTENRAIEKQPPIQKRPVLFRSHPKKKEKKLWRSCVRSLVFRRNNAIIIAWLDAFSWNGRESRPLDEAEGILRFRYD